MSLNPYEELGVQEDDPPAAIKKAYYKLCLQFHPDKLGEAERETHKERFERIQLSYNVLGDVRRRERFDRTGRLDDSLVDDETGEVDWLEVFCAQSEKVTKEMIDQDKEIYQGSPEEEEDVKEAIEFYEGEFLKLFEAIPHLEFDEHEERRVFDLVQGLAEDLDLEERFPKWKKYVKDRKREIRKYKRKLSAEAAEAEELLKEIDEKKSLKELIQRKPDPFAALIAKYENASSNGVKKPKGKARRKPSKKSSKKSSVYDISEEEFAKTQSTLGK